MNRKSDTDTLLKGLTFVLPALIIIIIIFVVTAGYKSYKRLRTVTQIDTEFKKYVAHIDMSTLESDLILFPKDDVRNMNIKECYYCCQTGIFDTSYQVYMICDFDKEQFENELARIQNVCVNANGEVQGPMYSDTGFDLPAYISIFEDTNYEYILVDQEHKTMKYILNFNAEPENGAIPDDMLPKKFKPFLKNTEEGYNMYFKRR